MGFEQSKVRVLSCEVTPDEPPRTIVGEFESRAFFDPKTGTLRIELLGHVDELRVIADELMASEALKLAREERYRDATDA